MELEREYLLQNYGRYPSGAASWEGDAYLYDLDGKRYLDFIAGIGVNALGRRASAHLQDNPPAGGLLIHSSNLYYHEYQGPLAKNWRKSADCSARSSATRERSAAGRRDQDDPRVHGNKVSPEKIEILTMENSFHGRTMGALSVMGQPGTRRISSEAVGGGSFCRRATSPLRSKNAMTDRTAGVIIEWIQGEGGIFPITAEYALQSAGAADCHNALLIFDEIQCGVGRTRHVLLLSS